MTPPPPGPRDWAPAPDPSEWASRPPTTRSDPSHNTATSATHHRGTGFGSYSAWISLILGTLAIGFAAIQPVNNSVQQGFLMSGVGIWAVAAGLQVLKRRDSASSARVIAARIGVVFGAIGTLVMVYTLAAFFLISAGIQLPALPWAHLVNYPASAPGLPLEFALPADVVTPTQMSPEERAELETVKASVSSIASLMEFYSRTDGAWPETLAVTTDGLTVLLPTGEELATLPAGSTLAYELTPDRLNYMLTITGALYASAVGFSSETGVISWQE